MEIRTQDAVSEGSGAEYLARIDALESGEHELFDDIRLLEHQVVMDRVEKEFHAAREVESTEAVTDAKVELVSAKEALRVLEGRLPWIGRLCVVPSRGPL